MAYELMYIPNDNAQNYPWSRLQLLVETLKLMNQPIKDHNMELFYNNFCRFLHTFDGSLAEKFSAPVNSIVVFQPEIFQSKYEAPSYTFSKKSGTYKEIKDFIT